MRAGILGIVAASVMGMTARADFTDLGPAQGFNVFVFGDDTQYGTDAQGRVAVGGNAFFAQNGQGYAVASNRGNNTTNLIVGGGYTNQYQTIKGSVFVDGNVSVVDPTITGGLTANGNVALNPTGNQGGTISGNVRAHGTIANNGVTISGTTTQNGSVTASPVDFVAAQASLMQLSLGLAAQPQTAGATVTFAFNNLVLTGPVGSSYDVFHVTSTQLATMNDLKIIADAGATVVIDVDDVGGHADSFHNNGINIVGTDRQHVLFNFSQATSLDTHGIGIQGSLLAPNAAVNFNSGNIDGTLIAASVSGNGESHDFAFQGTLARPVPEPGSVALLIVGGLGVGLAFRRSKATA